MSEETFYVLVPAPEEGTREEIMDYIQRVAQDLADADGFELILTDAGGESVPQEQVLRGGFSPDGWGDANAAYVVKIKCPGKGLTVYDHEVKRPKDPGPLDGETTISYLKQQ